MKTGSPPLFESILPFIFLFGIMYFLVIRPQSKRAKLHEGFITALKRGDQVVTASGILGTIDGITDHFVTLEIADGVRIKVLRKQIASSQAALMQDQKSTDKKG